MPRTKYTVKRARRSPATLEELMARPSSVPTSEAPLRYLMAEERMNTAAMIRRAIAEHQATYHTSTDRTPAEVMEEFFHEREG